ncbi:MAG: Mut7-C RNAse domain-containing protein [Deltaproteobacteria bacterium]|nr:Mut7-C RNAse domain-containing protein [Deltaproteobacteria bacterium]
MDDARLPAEAAPRFICDVHLGILARRLRLLGFDTVYRNDLEDDEIIRIATEDQRIILTRDGEILGHRAVRSYRPDSIFSDEQVREVLAVFVLREKIRPFSRCITCNGELIPVEKDAIITLVPPRSGRFMKLFWQCQGCRKVYWQGSHYETLKRWIADIVQRSLNR